MANKYNSKTVVVLATGVFDILHPGHVFYLNQSKKLGDRLVVLVTSDQVAKAQKRQPLFNQSERKAMVENLKMVDEVVIGNSNNDHCQTVSSLHPDIIALGYDQLFDEGNLKTQLSRCGWKGRIVRLTKYPNKNQSTTNIMRTIYNSKIKYQKSK